MGMEGGIARWYAKQTKKSLDEFKTLACRVADTLPAGSKVLDLAPGPGYFAIELAKIAGYEVVGLDISETFIDIAQKNAAKEGVQVDFRRGSASDMPFPNETFDFVLCRAAFKNFTEPVRALEEMHRTLRPGGRALIIDLRRDAPVKSINEAVNNMHLGVVNAALTKITFRFMLLKRAYTRSQLEQMIGATKFGEAQIQENWMGFEIMLSR